jgi:hypothetical protein
MLTNPCSIIPPKSCKHDADNFPNETQVQRLLLSSAARSAWEAAVAQNIKKINNIANGPGFAPRSWLIKKRIPGIKQKVTSDCLCIPPWATRTGKVVGRQKKKKKILPFQKIVANPPPKNRLGGAQRRRTGFESRQVMVKKWLQKGWEPALLCGVLSIRHCLKHNYKKGGEPALLCGVLSRGTAESICTLRTNSWSCK